MTRHNVQRIILITCLCAMLMPWPWLSEFSSVVLSCFTPSHWTIFTNVSLNQTGRLDQLIVQGNSVFSVMGQDS